MPKELKKVVNAVVNNDLICGIIILLILLLLKQYKTGLILFIGLIVSMLNFVVSAIVTNNYLIKLQKNKANLFSLSYLIRIISIVAIALVFSNNISSLLSFLIGFLIHYIILVITTIEVQRGSE